MKDLQLLHEAKYVHEVDGVETVCVVMHPFESKLFSLNSNGIVSCLDTEDRAVS